MLGAYLGFALLVCFLWFFLAGHFPNFIELMPFVQADGVYPMVKFWLLSASLVVGAASISNS